MHFYSTTCHTTSARISRKLVPPHSKRTHQLHYLSNLKTSCICQHTGGVIPQTPHMTRPTDAVGTRWKARSTPMRGFPGGSVSPILEDERQDERTRGHEGQTQSATKAQTQGAMYAKTQSATTARTQGAIYAKTQEPQPSGRRQTAAFINHTVAAD